MGRVARIVVIGVAAVGFIVLLGFVTRLAFSGGDAAESAPSSALELHPLAGSFRPDDTELDSCDAAPCWEQAFGNLAYNSGPQDALKLFDRRMAADPAVEAACHRIAHTIGSAALARYEGDVGQAFAEGSASCWSGYYHGILERALLDAQGDDQLVTVAQTLCSGDAVKTTTYLYYQCVHGLGHGLMIQTGLDLNRSLEVCEQLETQWDQTSCDGGVFMENFSSSYSVRSRFIRDDDPVYPCNVVATRHKLYCYLQVTDRLLETSNYDWADTARRCASVEVDWRSTCFQSFGRSASGYSRPDGALLMRLCNVPAKEWRSDCVYGAVRDIVSQDAGATRAAGFCHALDEEPLRERCFEGAGTILASLARTPEELREACTRLSPRYAATCVGRA